MSENTYRVGEHDVRPWGNWTVLDIGPGYAVKRIRVVPGGVLSLQRHRHRAESWVIVAGTAEVTVDGRVFSTTAGEHVAIPLGAVHRIANRRDGDVVFIEVQTGSVLSETDIERLEDQYGRG